MQILGDGTQWGRVFLQVGFGAGNGGKPIPENGRHLEVTADSAPGAQTQGPCWHLFGMLSLRLLRSAPRELRAIHVVDIEGLLFCSLPGFL